MKRTGLLVILLAICLYVTQGYSQVVNESTKKRISIGVGLFTDIMMKMPSGIKSRIINQGVNIFGTYNIPFGKSNFSFAIGLGLGSHNIYGNFFVNSTSDSTALIRIPDSVKYKRSKIALTYLEIPLEFRFKSNSKVNVGLGFKGGFLIGSNTKYVGDGPIKTTNYTLNATGKQRVKFWGINNLEQFTYGPTLRIGYKWFNVTGYYMLSSLFTKNRGPEMYPISVGFVLMPF
jgi:Outer membrane protein beta-barrel domain